MKPLYLSLFLVLAAAWAMGQALPNAEVLPAKFAGWQMTGSARTSQDASVADPAEAPLLKEFGFTDLTTGAYAQEGRTLQVKAARFHDASGALGAFLYYRQPQMLPETIGDQGASLNERILFFRGNVLIDARFSQLTAMSAAQLRELAKLLPLPGGGERNPATLPGRLPKEALAANSARYVLGPVGLAKVKAPVNAEQVDFQNGAEVVVGTYSTSLGDSTFTLIEYPTPQIAAEHLRRIDAAHAPTSQPGANQPAVMDLDQFFSRRTGPIVELVAGPITAKNARDLLESVNYDASVTWNENTYFDKKNNVANLIVNVILLAGAILFMALIAGIGFGGLRIVAKKFFPDRFFDRPEAIEIISLHLSEDRPAASSRAASHSTKAT